MDLQLHGKTAVVLGGTRGIGRAIAETYAREGANVAICARSAEQVSETVLALRALGVEATGASVDITDADALKQWITAAGEELGGIDLLVSNAGAMAIGADAAAWEQNFKLDVMGMVHAFAAAKPFLKAAAKVNGDASFVVIASVSAAETDNASAYGPIKAALIHFAKGLARQYAAQHIRTNVVSPGTVYFPGGVWNTIETHQPETFAAAMARNPMGRMATPQEVATAAVFLSSPLSAFTSGVNLLVDGAISRRVNF
jgi:3-oxoacyl-[acyl-carrier protein] reductase